MANMHLTWLVGGLAWYLLGTTAVLAQNPSATEKSSRVKPSGFATGHFNRTAFSPHTENESNIYFVGPDGERIKTFQSAASFTVRFGDSTAAKRTFKFFYEVEGKKASPIEFQTSTVNSSFRGFRQTVFVDDFPPQVIAFTVQEFINGRFVAGATCYRSFPPATR